MAKTKEAQLIGVCARDLMSVDLVTLNAGTPVAEAVSTLDEYKINGAPIVDGAGALVGVISTKDLMNSEHLSEGRLSEARSQYYLMNPLAEDEVGAEDATIFNRDDYGQATLGRDTVSEWMQTKIHAVAPDAKLGEVCRVMAKESIHRVLVVEDGNLVGIVSSFDVVRHFASEL